MREVCDALLEERTVVFDQSTVAETQRHGAQESPSDQSYVLRNTCCRSHVRKECAWRYARRRGGSSVDFILQAM